MKFKSQVYTQASGSVGGLTYSHNKSGMYTRSRTIPTNPNTTRQQIVRAGVNAAVQGFQALTDAEIAAWKLYGDNVPVLNALGDPIILSAQQQYIRTNSIRNFVTNQTATWIEPASLSLAPIDAAPTAFNTGESVSAYTLFDAPGTVGHHLSGSFSAPLSDSGNVLIFYGRPQNAGRRFYKGPYQLGGYVAVNAAATTFAFTVSQVDFSDFADNIDNPPAAGLWQPVRTRVLFDDGRVSQDFQDFVLWAASST